MRIFPGAFVDFDAPLMAASMESYAPAIEVLLRWDDRSEKIDLLIDTGAEVSVLYPEQAGNLLGVQYEQIVRLHHTGREYIGGIEAPLHRAFRLPLEMSFYDEDGTPYRLDSSILVAEPRSPAPDDPDARPGNMNTPSLLGRDLLLHFDLHMSGARGEVYLSLPD